jgi:ABC-2 type transport system permease protein
VPKFTANLSKYLYPTPTATEYQASLKESLEKGIDGHNPYNEFAKAFEDSVLKANKVDSLHQLPFNYWGLVMQAGEEHERVVYDKHVQMLNNTYLAQLRLHKVGAVFSPTSLTKMLTMQFAKTDLQAHFHFAKKAEDYRIALVGQMNKEIEVNSKYDDWDYIPSDPKFFEKSVKFEYQPITLTETMQFATNNLLLLGFWFGITLGVTAFLGKKINI